MSNRRNLTKMALNVLSDVTVSRRHAKATATLHLRRRKPVCAGFVMSMGLWLRGVRLEDYHDEVAELRWADDGGRA